MNLLVFCYGLALFLFIFSYYLDSHSEKSNNLFTTISMTSAFVALFAAVAANLLYTGNVTIGSLVFKFCLIGLAFVSISLMRFAISIPYNAKQGAMNFFTWILLAIAFYVVFSSVKGVEWSPTAGFLIKSGTILELFDAMLLYVYVFLYGIPGIVVLSLFVRGVAIHSRIYRQRMLFVAVSICVGFAVSFLLFMLSRQYYWALPFVPFGLAVMLILIHRSVSITTLFDRSLVVATLINFSVLSLVFSVVTAFVAAILVTAIPVLPLLALALVAVCIIMLTLRDRVAHRLGKYVRVGSEYESELETGLDAIDYNSGGDAVIQRTVALLDQYVGCSSVDILVSDDKGKLVTAYSSSNAKNEIGVDNKAIDFLLNRNESIVLKTQAITNHIYADVKADVLKIFDIGRADAFILLREGHRIIGLILLGPKKRGNDYTDYDYTVLSKLYSNFFLVMYYLKNIANESVVMTVDRELEFSGQIITSIQENIDRINHEKVDVDFITRSARKLGGDFIDFVKLADDKYLFVMGDVSGKGLNASMSMVILKSVLRTFLSETGDFKQLVVKVNLFIKNNLPKGTFFAGVFGLMDFSTNTMYYINCGVPAMFLYTASYNNAIEIQGDGKVLGFVRDIGKYLKVKKIVLNPQDIILLTTDGLVDATNLRGERFGKDRVQRMLMDNRSYPAGRMAKFLCDHLSEFVSREIEDDITVLVFKYLSK